jgi:hypothetical protein
MTATNPFFLAPQAATIQQRIYSTVLAVQPKNIFACFESMLKILWIIREISWCSPPNRINYHIHLERKAFFPRFLKHIGIIFLIWLITVYHMVRYRS